MSRDPRDWQADMDMCDQATTGPWKVYQKGLETLIGTEYDHPQLHAPDSIVGHAYSVDGERVYIRDKDAQLLAESREALPYWLQQYKEAVENLTDSHNELNWSYGQQKTELDKAEAQVKQLKEDNTRWICQWNGAEQKYLTQSNVIAELRNENKRLKKLVETIAHTPIVDSYHVELIRIKRATKSLLSTLYHLDREDNNHV